MRFGGRRLLRLLVIALVPLVWNRGTIGKDAGEEQANAPSQDPFHIAPYLQNTSSDGITIMWETKKPTISEVEYWQMGNGARVERRVVEGPKVKIHKVRIGDLKGDTQYTYRVRCGGHVREGDFFTAPAKSRPIRFAVFGDSRFWRDYWQTTGLPRHLLSRKPEFALHMGDLVNNGDRYREWLAHFARFGSILKHVAMFPARGNHERDGSKDPENDWFGKYHDLPGGEPYSSFDWGNSHFAIVSYTHIGECASFLDADLGATKKRWKFVAFHYPVYCTGYDSPSDKRKAAGNPELEALFDKHGVDMVLAGHTHIYERSFPLRAGKRDDRNGTVYLVQGGAVGGHYPDWWSATVAKDFSFPHYTLLEVANDRIELRSYGLAKGERGKGEAAKIIEIDRYIRWKDEALPQRILADLPDKEGRDLFETIENLGAMSYGPAAEVVVRYLDHGDMAVRRAAALALERIANADVSDRLVTFLRQDDIVVRRHVARALEAAMLPEVAGQIVPEILDPAQDSQVRVRLLGALLHHAPKGAFRVAVVALEARNPAVRDRAADVVKRTATAKDVPVLVEMHRREKRPYVAACLAWGIQRLASERGDRSETEKPKSEDGSGS